jgi:CelD/BcsL family acetyltransferase involved in cellulose biosynthesis
VISVELLRTAAAVESLREEWDALADIFVGATPFQRPAWAMAWMQQMSIASPLVVAIRCGRDLVGIVPGFVSDAESPRTFSLLGAGASDHLDAIAAPGFERATLDALRGWMEDAREQWQACTLDEIGPRAVLRDLRVPSGARATIEPQSVCPVLAIAEEHATALEDAVPRPQVARLRKARRRAERMGSVDLSRADRGDFIATMRTLFALHAKRWELRREPGVLGDSNVRKLHENVSAAFAARGALRLYALGIGGQTAGIIYGFRERQRLHMYLQGIEPALERASPGMLLVGFAIDDALAEGIREIDFLRGGEPYKYAWGAMDEANARVCIAA